LSLKDRAWKIVNSRHLLWGVCLASFLESIIVPIPLETVLIPAMQIHRRRLWQLAIFALIGCLAGSAVGYGVGYFLFEAFGQMLIDFFGSPEQYDQIRQQMNRQGFWFILSIGVAPVPFQIAMFAAGATSYSFPLFLLATSIARAIRYFGLGLLVWKFGDQAEGLFRNHKLAASLSATVVVVLIWFASNMLAR